MHDQYSCAKQYHEVKIICKSIFIEERNAVAATCNNLALVYHGLAQFNQAKEYHEKSLIIKKEDLRRGTCCCI